MENHYDTKAVYDYDSAIDSLYQEAYQPRAPDEFYPATVRRHYYEYDAENRLMELKNSKDKIFWERDPSYEYYRHGPLTRTILGQQVQGVDNFFFAVSSARERCGKGKVECGFFNLQLEKVKILHFKIIRFGTIISREDK